ncbi:ABC transporter permease [Luteibacter rhizovicinus]|nr:FtsX-like permease family protein [Luteibacter rhizovicinus]
MQIKPILSALRHHKSGTLLIALQIALTLAIVCNALFIIQGRIQRLSRPTGIAESELMVVNNKWVGRLTDAPARQAADLATVRALPGVADAYVTNAFPLIGSGWQSGIRRSPTEKNLDSGTAVYFVDDHALSTLGVKLVAGRNFRSDEIGSLEENGSPDAPTIIVTRALAQSLYPDSEALGKLIYIGTSDARPSTIVGIVEHLQSPETGAGEDDRWKNVILVPMRLTSAGAFFVIRAKPAQLQTLLKTVPTALKANSTRRVIPEPHGVITFAQIRDMAYRGDRGLAWMMGGISAILLVVTAAGIVGLTSFWVGQRRRQIGIRRALGATRRDIVMYFLTENILISVGGIVGGVVLALVLNRWMMMEFETARLAAIYIVIAAFILLALGQLAVLAPALRASRVPPVEATRTV